MRPSEIIFQKIKKSSQNQSDVIIAIVEYLDEQYDKENSKFTVAQSDHCCLCVTACGHTTPPSYCKEHK